MCISTLRTNERTPKTLPYVVAELSKACANASKSMRKHLIVQHNYHDHAQDEAPSASDAQHALEDHTLSHNAFPLKLFEMLSLVDRDGFAHIVSWQPHGRCFVVHKPNEFKAILPRYFKLSKVASFQRQLNLYGFMRLTRGMDKGGYYHELFLKDRIWLAQKIQRVKVKGTGVRAKSNPAQEPNFWNMTWVNGEHSSSNSAVQSMEISSPRPVVTSTPHVDDCTTSVVSHDEEENTVTHPQHERNEIVSLPPQPPKSLEPQENTLVSSWGMPFYYLPRSPTSHHTIPSTKSTIIEDNLDDILGSMDFDEVVRDLLDDSKGQTFADLLERAAA